MSISDAGALRLAADYHDLVSGDPASIDPTTLANARDAITAAQAAMQRISLALANHPGWAR